MSRRSFTDVLMLCIADLECWVLSYRFTVAEIFVYHGLRASASPVLTATGLVNGRWRFSTPYRIGTP